MDHAAKRVKHVEKVRRLANTINAGH
jgi:hypothetical protein